MADSDTAFDPTSLLSNPLLMAGINLLGAKGNNIAGNVASGIQTAQQAQLGPITLALKQLELQRNKNAMNFNPADYMQTDQSSPNGLLSGSSDAQQQQAMQPPQTPAALAGPIGSGVGQPAQQAPSQQQVQFQPGQPQAGGNIDMPGLVSAGLKAGYNPQDINALAMSMNPSYFAKLQAMTKLYQPQKLGPGEQLVIPAEAGGGGNNGVIASNDNAPPSSDLGQINMLQAARDKYQPGTPQWQTLDAALKQKSGVAMQDYRKEVLQNANYRTYGDPQANEQMADAIGNYKQAPLSGYSAKTPQGSAIMAKVYEKYPNYNSQNYQSSQKAYSAFTSGKQGDTVRSFNVAIEHLATLGPLVDAMQNGDTQSLNRLANAYKTQFGQTAPTNFDAAKSIVSDEVTKAIIGSQNALGDRDTFQGALDQAKSPQQLKGVMQTWTNLMAGQLKGLSQQYKAGTMRDDFKTLLTPNALNAVSGGQMRTPVRSGMVNGKKVVQYNDGTLEYMDQK